MTSLSTAQKYLGKLPPAIEDFLSESLKALVNQTANPWGSAKLLERTETEDKERKVLESTWHSICHWIDQEVKKEPTDETRAMLLQAFANEARAKPKELLKRCPSNTDIVDFLVKVDTKILLPLEIFHKIPETIRSYILKTAHGRGPLPESIPFQTSDSLPKRSSC